MKKNVSPSEITPGQIGKFLDLQVAALRKSGLPGEQTQQVLESQGGVLADEFVAMIRRRVEAISDLITRRAPADRLRSPQETLKATGRRQYVDDDVVATMPRGEGDEAEVVFFKLGRYISDNDLEKEYELRGLKAADPYSLSAVNEVDPTFADDHPNCTQWCYAAFRQWVVDERDVGVYRHDYDWRDDWWFAGCRK
jgi:hypothetical protein